MTSYKTLAATLLVATVAAASPAAADQISERQQDQSWRIDHGVNNGTLTPREADSLREEQRYIASLVDEAMRDGYMSPAEKWNIMAVQQQAGLRIYAEKRDAENVTQPQWSGGWGHNRDRRYEDAHDNRDDDQRSGHGYGHRRWWSWN